MFVVLHLGSNLLNAKTPQMLFYQVLGYILHCDSLNSDGIAYRSVKQSEKNAAKWYRYSADVLAQSLYCVKISLPQKIADLTVFGNFMKSPMRDFNLNMGTMSKDFCLSPENLFSEKIPKEILHN